MANHIANRLVVTADSKEELKLFLNAIRGVDGEDKYIDFNKIIPMPEEIKNTESSSMVDDAIYYYLVKSNQEGLLDTILRYSINSMDRFKDFSQDKLDELFALGKKHVEIYLRYGAKDWYDWSRINWGTKWNAYNTDLEYLDENVAVVSFQTAWSAVPEIIAELVECYPALCFEYDYADENIGYNCGTGHGEDGDFLFTTLIDGGLEAMSNYMLCWGYDESDFYCDDNGNWHNREREDDDSDI